MPMRQDWATSGASSMVSDTQGSIRVRFAPSPTGHPHVGNIRTALFNWLFARHTGGVFVLRIEDTDTTRRIDGAVESIIEGLSWLGLDWDEGPVFQSDRLSLYRDAAETLIQQGAAYRCFCTPARLEQVRAELMRQHLPPRYDGHCRDLSPQDVASNRAAGIQSVVRFRTPREGETTFDDLIRGPVTFGNATLNDYVLLKSDGYPTYHLANVVDDHAMRITHIMRADEWISSTPLHVMLYAAFGWTSPEFAHLPMILGPDKGKLSKRHGATTIIEYREQGYLPETLFNFLALLGWALDDKTELFTRDELITSFSLERVGKTAAVFDKTKLDWMNGVYIRALPIEEFTRRALSFLERDLPESVPRPLDVAYVGRVATLLQERTKVLSELGELSTFFFEETLQYPAAQLIQKGMGAQQTLQVLQSVLSALEELKTWDAKTLESLIRPVCDHLEMSPRQVFGVLRVAVTGRTAAPPLFDTMEVLGKAHCLTRFYQALALIENQK